MLFELPTAAQDTASHPSTSASARSYPDSTAGLKKLVDDFLSAMKKGNGAAQVAIFQSIFLPEAKSWFQGAFGPEGGAKLGDRYARESTAFPSPFVGIFTVILNEKLTDIEVLRFDKACDARANTYEYPVLAAFERVPKLYAVRASNLSTHKLLKSAFFVYADGGFR